MADTPDITAVISSPAFKAAKPEVQKALLLKHFPDRYNETGEDFSGVTGGASTVTDGRSSITSAAKKATSISAPSAYERERGSIRIGDTELPVSYSGMTGLLPAVGATIGAIAGPPGMGLGGAGGSLVQNAIDQLAGGRRLPGPIESIIGVDKLPAEARGLASAGLEGVEQFLGGKVGNWVMDKAFGALLPKAPVGELEKVAAELGLPLKNTTIQKVASKSPTGFATASKGRTRGMEKIVSEAEKEASNLGVKGILPPAPEAADIKDYVTKVIAAADAADEQALKAAKEAARLEAQVVNEANAAKYAEDVAAAKQAADAANARAAEAHATATRFAKEHAKAEKATAVDQAKIQDETDIGNLLSQLSENNPREAGAFIKATIGGEKGGIQGSAKLGQKEGARLYSEAQSANADQLVDLGGYIDELKRLKDSGAFAESPALKKYASKYLVDDVNPEEIATEMYGDIGLNRLKQSSPQRYEEVLAQIKNDYAGVPGKSTVTFSEALSDLQSLRSGLKAGELSSPKSRGLIKHLVGNLSQAIDDSIAGKSSAVLAGTPEGAAAWRSAEQFWSQYSGTFKRGMVPRMMKALEQTPEDLLKFLTSPSRVDALREATIGYTSRYGNEGEKAAAENAFRSVQSAFVRSKIFSPGADIAKQVAKHGDTLKTLFADNPEFVDTLQNIAEATKKAKAVATSKPYVVEIPKPEVIKPVFPEPPAKVKPATIDLPPSPERVASKARLIQLAKIAQQTPKLSPIIPVLGTGAAGTLGLLAKLLTVKGIALAGVEEGLSYLVTAAAYDPIAARSLNGMFGNILKGGKASALGLAELGNAIQQIDLERQNPPAPTPLPPHLQNPE